MPVIAVINRKGGSGKSTLATHLAAWCARRGHAVMLGDVDRQQSSRAWLRLRDAQPAAAGAGSIVGWTSDAHQMLRPPAGIRHVVLDTPGGLRGTDLARLVMHADAILMPVCHSLFDRTSAADCHAELRALPRVASGRCRIAAVGMRVDARTRAAEALRQWAARQELDFLGVLRETQAYVRSVEQGLTLFDLPRTQVQADLAQWQPILDWLEPLLQAPADAPQPRRVPRAAAPARRPPGENVQALEALVARQGLAALPGNGGGVLGWLARRGWFGRGG
jgi:chromosome partitioning protein